MIVVAIIGILASIAIPKYQTYAKRSKFAEVILQSSNIKTAIDICYNTRGAGLLSNCDSELKVGVTLTDIISNHRISSAAIAPTTAVITLTASIELDSETYILTPVSTAGSLIWQTSGSCIAAGIC